MKSQSQFQMTEKELASIKELKACFEEAVNQCDEILMGKIDLDTNIHWLIHDWDQKMHRGYNDSLAAYWKIMWEAFRRFEEQVNNE